MSILATTVSIVLTFGTAAIIDHHKQENDKREIVMMVMYDMYNSLEMVQRADSALYESMNIQLKLAKDTTQYDVLWMSLAAFLPQTDFTETTEHIFSTSMETIHTLNNVLFTENVAGFYRIRHDYKTMVNDSINKEIVQKNTFSSLKATLNFRYMNYAILSRGFVKDMQMKFEQCKQMMDVSDNDLDAYRKEREKIECDYKDIKSEKLKAIDEIITLQNEIDAAKPKLN